MKNDGETVAKTNSRQKIWQILCDFVHKKNYFRLQKL